MSKADEMFEKIKYKLIYQDKNSVCYRNNRNSHIYFRNDDKTIDLATNNINNKILTLEQLQAINEKVKELGWNE